MTDDRPGARDHSSPPGRRRAVTGRLTGLFRRQLRWFVWGIGAGVYVLALLNRTSLGVAGPQALDRFSITAAQLSTFLMLQIGVYAAMQIPTGILVDRFGPRRMLIAAAGIMGLAQIAFALVPSYPLALLARGLLGVGDAMTYISVLRLVAGWFPARRYALLTSFTGLLGTLGNLLSTLPLTLLLANVGWTRTFIIAGSLSLAYVTLLLRPATRRSVEQAAWQNPDSPVAGRRVWTEVKQAWRVPAGRLAFWIHLTTMAGPQAFGVLWGYPYLVEGLGYDPTVASSMLLMFVLIGAGANLAVGLMVTRRPTMRAPLVVTVATASVVAWLVLIIWPGGRVPLAALVCVIAVLAVGAPASMVGFLLARDYNPRRRISTATGLVNVGGHFGTVIAIYAIGQILDIVDGTGGDRSLDAFRWAFAAVALLTVFGLSRILVWWLRTRAVVVMAETLGLDTPLPIRPRRWERFDPDAVAREAKQINDGKHGGAHEQ